MATIEKMNVLPDGLWAQKNAPTGNFNRFSQLGQSAELGQLDVYTDTSSDDDKKKPIQPKFEVPKVEDYNPKIYDEKGNDEAARRAQTAAIQIAVFSGKPVTFIDSEGTKTQLTVTTGPDSTYQFRLAGDEKVANAWIDPGFTPQEKLEGLRQWVDLRSRTPKQFRAPNQYELYPDQKDNTLAQYNSYYKRMRQFGLKNGADASNGKAVKGDYDHENGHSIWDKVDQKAWMQAIQTDGNQVSGYGRDSNQQNMPGEDFAEAWSSYMEAKSVGGDALDQLRQKFPNRVAVMDELWKKGEQEPGFLDGLWATLQGWAVGTEDTSMRVLTPLDEPTTMAGEDVSVSPSNHQFNARSMRNQALSELGLSSAQVEAIDSDPKLSYQFRIFDSQNADKRWASKAEIEAWSLDQDGMTTINFTRDYVLELKAWRAQYEKEHPTVTPQPQPAPTPTP